MSRYDKKVKLILSQNSTNFTVPQCFMRYEIVI